MCIKTLLSSLHCIAGPIKNLINNLVPSLQLVTVPNADALEHLGNALGLEEAVPEEVVWGRNQRDLSLQIEENL